MWWLAGSWLQPPTSLNLPLTVSQLQLPGNGYVRLQGAVPVGPLHVAYRQGGERLEISGRGSRDLKRLLNESGVPTFVRGRIPLLLCGERVLAVANLPGLDGPFTGAWQLQWQAPTSDRGLS